MPARTTRRPNTNPRYTLTTDGLTIEPVRPVQDRIYNAYDMGYGNMETGDIIRPLLFELANELKKDIYYGNPHEDIVPPLERTDGSLTWLFWSAPQPCNTEYKLTAFGMTLNGGQKSSLRIEDLDSEVGDLYKDDDGVAVMLVCGDTVYIPFDLPHQNSRYEGIGNHDVLMGKLIELYKSTLDPKEVEMRRVAAATVGAKNVPLVLKTLMFSNDEGRRRDLQVMISNRDERLHALEESMKTVILERRRYLNDLNALNANTDQDAQVEKVIRSLGKLHGIDKVTSRTGNKLIIQTEPVFIDTTLARYNLGRYSIELESGRLKIKAIDKPTKPEYQGRSDHPHVLGGEPCLGNMKEIYDFIAQGDVVMTVASTLEFLHSYNPDSAYTQIDMWERVAVMKDGVMTDIKTEEPVELVGVIYPGERSRER